MVFLAILAVARMVIWTTQNKGLYDDANLCHRDLVCAYHFISKWKYRQINIGVF